MGQLLLLANNYEAAAAAGYDGFSSTIEVDKLPYEFDGSHSIGVPADSIFMPITLEWNDGGVSRMNLLCTGWTDSPSKMLYVDPPYISGTASAVTVRCSPNRETSEFFQRTQSLELTPAAGPATTLDIGITTYLNIEGARTLSLTSARNGQVDPFGSYQQARRAGEVTRLILKDINANQPVITWGCWDGTLLWENGAPQFTPGKTRLVVELVGGDGLLLGSFKQFA